MIGEVLRDRDALASIAGRWNALVDRSPAATVFQRPEWLLPWLRHLAPEADVEAIAIRRGGELVALAPMHRSQGALVFVGAGVTDALDAIGTPSELAPLVDAIGDHAARIVLDDLPEDALLRRAVPRTHEIDERRANVSPFVDLPDTYGAFEAHLAPRFAENLRYAARRLSRLADVRWSIADRDSLDDALDALFRLHAARWSMKGERGVLADPRVQAFHRDVARAFLRRDALRLHVVTIGGAHAGALELFVDRDRASYYLSGFDPAFAKLSLGSLLVRRAVEDAIELGARRFELLRGGEPYKYAWGAVDRALYRRELSRR